MVTSAICGAVPTSRLSGSFIRTRIRLRSSNYPAFHEHPAQHVAHLRIYCALPRTFCACEWTPQLTPCVSALATLAWHGRTPIRGLTMTRIIMHRLLAVPLLLPGSTTVQAQTLKVTLLGTGSPIPTVERFGPSTLVGAGSEKLLIDCGRGVPIRLWQLHVPMSALTAVIFTHLHSDHISGFPDLWLTGWLPPPFGHRVSPMHVFGPVGTCLLYTSDAADDLLCVDL